MNTIDSNLVTEVMSNFSKSEIYTDQRVDFYKYNPLPYDCPDSVRINFNNKIATGYWDVLSLSDDILTYIVDNEYVSDFSLPYVSQKDHMVFRFALCGDMIIRSDRDQNIVINGAGVTYFSSPEQVRTELNYCKGSNHKMITLYVSRKKLHELWRVPALDSHATNKLFAEDGLSGCNLVLIPEMRNIVIDIFSTQFFGPLRQVYVKAKINELLCHTLRYISTISNDLPTSVISTRDQDKVRRAFEHLSENYLRPPHIDTISRQVGLNRTVLRKYFKTIYGQTISEFCMVKRMVEARSKLLQSDMNITQLSQYLGYDHPANFTTAFKRHFGMLPKDLRQRTIN